MKIIISGIVICLLLSVISNMSGQEVEELPRDTTYNLMSTTLKIKKQYPYAEPVKATLDSLRIEKSAIVYRTIGNRKLHMDLYREARSKTEKYACILCIHGGGWASGNKTLLAPLAQELAKQGYLTATVEYRLSPEAPYPAAVTDVKSAVKWIKRNAESYHLDTNRIAILGTSAGATIATLVGNTPCHARYQTTEEDACNVSDRVKAIMNIDGILDFSDPAESGKDKDPEKPSAATRWLGSTFSEDPGLWIEASPLSYAGEHSPATLFINSSIPRFHAGRDEYIRILDNFGIRSTVFTIHDSPHSFWLFHPWFDITLKQILKFSDAVL
jgi:pectinesterase